MKFKNIIRSLAFLVCGVYLLVMKAELAAKVFGWLSLAIGVALLYIWITRDLKKDKSVSNNKD
jgi:hypothetical protein